MAQESMIFDRIDWNKIRKYGVLTIHDAIVDVQDRTVELAVQKSPYLTGHNRNSIAAGPLKEDGREVIGEVFTESGYGGYLELGTSRMKARPYLQPAAIQAVKQMLKTK